MKFKYLLLPLIVFLLIGCDVLSIEAPVRNSSLHDDKNETALSEKSTYDIRDRKYKMKNVIGLDPEDDLYIVSNPESIQVYLNKQRKLPDDYEPTDLVEANVTHLSPSGDDRRLLREEAANMLEVLFEKATEEGLSLAAVSGYRSNDRQRTLYENSVRRNGQEHADRYSAKPGTSEHESGLAMDVSTATVAFALDEVFQETSEGEWLKNHAHEFGFIIRYPEGKEEITGYAYEPWHLRYVGKELAQHLFEHALTLEEYFGYHY